MGISWNFRRRNKQDNNWMFFKMNPNDILRFL